MPEVAPTFDLVFWEELIKKHDWYVDYVRFATNAQNLLDDDSRQAKDLKEQIRSFFEASLQEGKVALAHEGPNLDKEREPIDTIVIHHTSHSPGYKLDYMNAVQLLNVYARAYTTRSIRQERNLEIGPIWSGHFRNGKPSFLCYHWLMRMDGSFERLLDDNQIGWHAGNWGINKRSIAICLDNDYETQDPTSEIIQKLATHIKNYYPDKKIIGHCEAIDYTICPGTNFLNSWKVELLKALS